MQRNTIRKRLTKRTYVYLGLVTMAAISLLAKPIKRGFSALEKRLTDAKCEETQSDLREALDLRSDRIYNANMNGEIYDFGEKDPFSKQLEDRIEWDRRSLKNCHRHKHELD